MAEEPRPHDKQHDQETGHGVTRDNPTPPGHEGQSPVQDAGHNEEPGPTGVPRPLSATERDELDSGYRPGGSLNGAASSRRGIPASSYAAGVSPGAAPVAATGSPPAGEKATEAAPTGAFRWDVVRALRHRNYRLFILGAFLSNIGGWLANVAQGYLVYDLTGSKALLGVLAFVSTIPVLILGPVAGVVADRFHKKSILLTTQTIFLVDYTIIAVLLFTDQLEIWQLLTLSAITGVAMAFNSPAYQSLTVEFVGPEDLMNAIALNSMQFNLSRIVGGLAGGFLYVLLGKAWCFALDALSFVAVIAALLMVNIRPPSPKARSFGIWENFLAGLRYLVGHRDLMAIVAMAATVTLFILPYFTMLPVYAKDILRGDARMQSILLTGVGVGALAAAFIQASARRDGGKGLEMLYAMGVLSVCLVIFAFSRSLSVSLVALVGLGASMVGFMTSANTSMQLLIPDEMRGRLMGVFVMVSFGIGPIGSLVIGLVAAWTSAPVALVLGAAVCGVATAAAALWFPHIRRI